MSKKAFLPDKARRAKGEKIAPGAEDSIVVESQEAATASRKIAFAEEVLAILCEEPDWSSDTLDRVADAAMAQDLAELNGDGYFAAKGNPQTTP
jgi:hypothetical protein